MAVNLKLIPQEAALPSPPKWWLWLGFLLILLLAGIITVVLRSQTKNEINAEMFLSAALIAPVAVWLTLISLRIACFWGQSALVRQRNKIRETTMARESRRGQRYLSVLDVSLHTALRQPDDVNGQRQWDALLNGEQALKTQPCPGSDDGVRHSRLPRSGDESAEQVLTRTIVQMQDRLSFLLASLPAGVPLNLLIEHNGCLPAEQVLAVWQRHWDACHIRQSVKHAEGSGFAAVDHWLDERINEPSLLLIVAIQLAPEQPKGTAEAIAGLLLGRKLQQTIQQQTMLQQAALKPLANLHRPEQMQGTGSQDLHYALQQSLNWGKLSPEGVTGGWLAGVDKAWHQAIASGLADLSSPVNIGRDLHDLDSRLGYSGPVAPWLGVACAIAGCRRSEAQFIITGDGTADSPLWSAVVTTGA